MVLRDLAGELLLDVERGLNDGGDEPRGDVPFDVAVEEPDAGVVGAEAEHDVAVGVDEDGVAAHGRRREGGYVGGVVEAGVVVAAVDYLEGVAVEMEGVFSGIVVVEDDFDDLVVAEDELVGVRAVYGGVGGVGAGGEDGVEGGYFRGDVCLAVEESAVEV